MADDDRDKVEEPPAGATEHGEKITIAMYFLLAHTVLHGFADMAQDCILLNYLRIKLSFSNDHAVQIFHSSEVLTIVLLPIGAILSDSFANKYIFVFFASIALCSGKVFLLVGAFPMLSLNMKIAVTLSAQVIEAAASACTKSTFFALQGDQFILREQIMLLRKYYYIQYIIFNSGVVVAYFISPLLVSEFPCLGEQDCYAMGFGLSMISELFALLTFMIGKKFYVLREPERNMSADLFKCIKYAIKQWKLERKTHPKPHWLDRAEPIYGAQMVSDIKRLVSMATIYSTFPIFWAVYDQLNSKLLIQASQTDGRVGKYTIIPDHFQLLNPILTIIVVGIALLIEPYLPKINMDRLFRKMVFGGVFVGIAFIGAGILETHIIKKLPEPPKKNEVQLHIFNGLNCSVSLFSSNILTDIIEITPLGAYRNKHIPIRGRQTFTVDGVVPCTRFEKKNLYLKEESSMSYYIREVNNKIDFVTFEEDFELTKSGLPVVTFLGVDKDDSVYVSDTKSVRIEVESSYEQIGNLRISTNDPRTIEVLPKTYDLYWNNNAVGKFELRMGGYYVVMVSEDSMMLYEIVAPNSIHMAWTIPQSIILVIGEVYFTVALKEFTYSEAPMALKSFASSFDYLVDGLGDLIIIVVTAIPISRSDVEFLIFGLVLITTMIILGWIATRFKSLFEGIKLI